MNEHHPQFWFRAEHVVADFTTEGERRIAAWLREQLQAAGYDVQPPQERSWGQRICIESPVPLYVDCAAARRFTGSPFAPPCWIAEITAEGGLRSGREGRLAPLPAVAQVGRDLQRILGDSAGAWTH